MVRRWMALFFAAALIAPGVFAQDYQKNTGRKNRRNTANQQKMSKQWAEAQAALKKKCPEEYAKIEELQKTNLFEAMNRFRELAAKEKIRLGGDRGMRNGNHPGRDGMPRPDFGRGMPGGRPGFGTFRNPRSDAEAQLKKDYPQDYAQVESLRKETENKLQALAKKAKVQLPDTPESYRMKLEELRQKYPAEMAEADKLKETDPRSANEKIQELAKKAGMELTMPFGFPGRFGADRQDRDSEPPARRSNDMNKLYKVQKAYPEEWNRIRDLRESDPAAAKKQLLDLIRKYENDVKNKK